jgi:hypothetical protein
MVSKKTGLTKVLKSVFHIFKFQVIVARRVEAKCVLVKIPYFNAWTVVSKL